MKRTLSEIGVAAMIFLAANTVYGIDSLMGNSLTSVSGFASMKQSPAPNIHVRLDADQNVRVPGPVSVDLHAEESSYTLCVGPEFGHQAVAVSMAGQEGSLRSQTGSVPYQVTLAVANVEGTRIAARVSGAACDGMGNVRLNVSIAPAAVSLVRRLVFTDTVTLVVNPE